MLERPTVEFIIRNLQAVQTGAMWYDPGSDKELFRQKLIRRNSAGWYDLTPAGRKYLADWQARAQGLEALAREGIK